MASSGATGDAVDDRYGGRRPAARGGRPRRLAVVAVVLALAAGVAVVTVLTMARLRTSVELAPLGYRVLSERSVEVRFVVTKPAGVAARCEVVALDRDRLRVGAVRVDVPAAGRRRTVTAVVPTTERALAARAEGCRTV